MRNKKFIRVIVSATAVLLSILLLFGCTQKSYGETFATLSELQEELQSESIAVYYPSYLGEKEKDGAETFIKTACGKENLTLGYKIYNFGSPFFVSVAAYVNDTGGVQSDDIARLTREEDLTTEKGIAELYIGKGHKDALFLIGAIALDGKRYEVRVTADKKMSDGNFINAIYKDNPKYPQAIDVLIRVIDGLEL